MREAQQTITYQTSRPHLHQLIQPIRSRLHRKRSLLILLLLRLAFRGNPRRSCDFGLFLWRTKHFLVHPRRRRHGHSMVVVLPLGGIAAETFGQEIFGLPQSAFGARFTAS
jgi:hypothetical protein